MPEDPYIIDDSNLEEETTIESPPRKSLVVARDVMPKTLLIVPLFDRPMFPKMLGPIMIDEDDLKKVIAEGLKEDTLKYLGLLLVQNGDDFLLDENPQSAADFYQVGVVVRILQVAPPEPDDPIHIMVQAVERFNVVELVSESPVFQAKVKYWPETDYKTNNELKAYSIAIVDSLKELVQLNPLYREGLSLVLDQIDVNEPGILSDLAAAMTTASGEDLQKLLETQKIRPRIEQALILLKHEIEISKIKVKINQRIEADISKQQREFFLRQQLKEIKKELGLSKEGGEAEVEKFEKRLKDLSLPQEAQERVEEELDKLSLLEPVSPEFSVTRAYLDWLTILPWGVYTEDNYDIKKAAQILDEDHYGLNDVKERILELISVGIIKGDLAGSIILLVGPPGVGKTSVGRSIARSLGREFYRFSLGGMRDEAEIKGHRRTYIGALPGKFIQALKTCRTANPVIMLDEIDKIGASFRGDPASALLEVLDPEQNKDFLDHYLDVRFDLSKVLFICTANQLETIPPPLLDRMENIRLAGYILEEKLAIANGYLIPKQLEAHGLTTEQVTISEAALREIIDGYAREAGVRGLENHIKKVLRKSAKKIVENDAERIQVDVADVDDWLGRRVFSEEQIYTEPLVGVVMGLAYTSMGGATLYIEATPVPAQSPGFKQTGQLGKVMIESSEIAYTYVRSLLRDDKAATAFFNGNFIHLHVPTGATPKDGPSAGVTMACSLYSLAVNQPIIEGVAMTGELTLSGLIMPIGGLKEKVIAAKRAKVTTLIFPAENQADFEELDDHIAAGLTPHFVRTFADVQAICFPEI